jgi:oligopeptide/dipeptide ABC transporter ATP-binding protein
MGSSTPLLAVEDLSVVFDGRGSGEVRAVDGVSFTREEGRVTGLVGESGCGKSVTSLALMGLLPSRGVKVGGSAVLRTGDTGADLLKLSPKRMRDLRGSQLAMIFQDPLGSLNPVVPIGRQVTEIPRRDGMSRRELAGTAVDLLERVEIPDPARRAGSYPHQFSGGMRQRAMTALALAGKPQLILADEPTTALDVTVQARILGLLRRLRDEEGTAMLLVSHDLRVMAHVADDLVVMYAGRVCERGPATAVLHRPLHPYTSALVRSVPAVHTKTAIAEPLPGSPANPAERPSGCAFHPRCPLTSIMAQRHSSASAAGTPPVHERCRTEQPEVREISPGRWAACHFSDEEVAP